MINSSGDRPIYPWHHRVPYKDVQNQNLNVQTNALLVHFWPCISEAGMGSSSGSSSSRPRCILTDLALCKWVLHNYFHKYNMIPRDTETGFSSSSSTDGQGLGAIPSQTVWREEL